VLLLFGTARRVQPATPEQEGSTRRPGSSRSFTINIPPTCAVRHERANTVELKRPRSPSPLWQVAVLSSSLFLTKSHTASG
jgi:hypothetical protein